MVGRAWQRTQLRHLTFEQGRLRFPADEVRGDEREPAAEDEDETWMEPIPF